MKQWTFKETGIKQSTILVHQNSKILEKEQKSIVNQRKGIIKGKNQ